jgi:hypothetical protein
MDGKICTVDGCKVIPLTDEKVRHVKTLCKSYFAVKQTIRMNCEADIFGHHLMELMDDMVGDICEEYGEKYHGRGSQLVRVG